MPTAQPLRTGDPQRLGGYELSGRLGEGGQGAVFLGSRGGETYAVKLLHGPVGDEPEAFLREVELAKQVARFCTAQVIDAGFDEGFGEGRPYIVSEYVDGPSLHREVALTGPRRGGALERLAVGTATAIVAIHRAGIVHRDFKPQNVLLGSDGPRVIDFGLAKVLDAAATVSGRGVGTPAYMAPEQITASAVSGKADVFSWGATMCFAANATAPFGQDSVAPVLHRILTAPPELGRLEGRLRALVAACLDKDARNRPSSRELLFELLGEASEDVAAEVLDTPPPAVPRSSPPLIPDPRPPETPRPASGAWTAAGEGVGSAGSAGAAGSGAGPMAEPEATGTPGGYLLPGPAGDSPPGAEGQDGRGDRWPRAAVAVCAALLVTAVVLVAVLVPLPKREAAGPGGRAPSEAQASEPFATKPSPTRPKETREAQRPPADSTVVRPVNVPIPPLAGLDRAAAIRAIERAGLVPGPITRADSRAKVGQVVGSSPASGELAPRGSTVSLRVSAGVPVPPVAGLRRGAAESALAAAGLVAGEVTRTCSDQPNGQVLSSRPKAGARVAGGTAVALTVARHGAEVPPVVGRPGADGRAALVAAGFRVRSQSQVVEEESRVGMILAQSVPPGTCAPPGGLVVITVGGQGQSGPDPTEPSPTAPPGTVAGG